MSGQNILIASIKFPKLEYFTVDETEKAPGQTLVKNCIFIFLI